MVVISIFSVLVALLITAVVANRLYVYSMRNNKLKSKKDYVINGVIIGFTFFCISSFSYVLLLNMF